MIYGNVNVDMNPDGLGAWEDIPTHVQVAGRYTIDDVQALLAKADTGLATSGLSPMSVIKSKQEILSKKITRIA